MTAAHLLKNDIPTLSYQDSALNGLSLMDEYDVGHLPVLNGDYYVGVISEDTIIEMDKPDLPLNVLSADILEIAISPQAHIYEVIKALVAHNVSLVPVIDEDMRYLGCITQHDVLRALAQTQAVMELGGVIVLEMNPYDYSLSKIARLVEENDAKILDASLTTPIGSSMLELSLKINKEDLNPILQTLNRHEYVVKAYFQKPQFSEDLKDRYEELMKYLNM